MINLHYTLFLNRKTAASEEISKSICIIISLSITKEEKVNPTPMSKLGRLLFKLSIAVIGVVAFCMVVYGRVYIHT